MRIRQPTPAEEAQWKEWLASRPESVRRVAEQFDPLSLYRIKSTGHRVTLHSFREGDPVTLVVNVLAKYNFVAFERRVFGVLPEDLEPCDLPGPDEQVGALAKTDAEIEAVVNIIKAHHDCFIEGDQHPTQEDLFVSYESGELPPVRREA